MINFTRLLTIASDLVDDPPPPSHLGIHCDTDEKVISRNAIFELIEACVSTFEAATQETYDR
jgi:hypothetical protein